jgi:hypothetical protein
VAKKKELMICGPATITNAIGRTLRKSMRGTLSQIPDRGVVSLVS